ncbi:hypothetical protein QWY81_18020 [Polaribacter undariae]|uniref:Uncharacterized protein n=1 Tax=Polaribacter sejongensis TaxID=985043 RepID=A0AAJ1R0D1_9FLAO|nr:hypothetical protein [Polaribacter undariae]MDN3621370.1 hypothetical protein [Polaribacter undariae]UWD31834.1 hypothetical protein NQP51_17095 [Polaribacter undariae]
MDKTLLSTYLLKIQDNNNNDQILSHFNGSDDFLNVFENYLNDIFQNILDTTDTRQTTSLHLTLDAPPTVDIENRRIYGYFSSGVSGEEYQIRDLESRENVLDVERNHGAFRNLFYYINIPTRRNSGSLILQRKARFGIKTVFKRTLNQYLRSQGYQIYKVLVNNIVHHNVYRRMMDEGNLKKVELIKRTIPNSIEQYYQNDSNPDQIPGVLRTSMSSSTTLPDNFKLIINNLFTNPSNETIEIAGIDEEFDEIEFELELNGKKKSFYIANRQRIQPDIDVTNSLEYENGIPTTESLVLQCEELVDDIITIRPR